jgi:myo-inositol-1(or 4)-monophosphatase
VRAVSASAHATAHPDADTSASADLYARSTVSDATLADNGAETAPPAAAPAAPRKLTRVRRDTAAPADDSTAK